MNTTSILSVLKKEIGDKCIGVFPSDKLPHSYTLPSGLVVNTDPSGKPGTHWLAIFINADGTVEFFDSYGLKPNVPTIEKFLKRFKKCHFNKKQIQGLFSSVCGHYSIYYIIQRCHDIPMEDIVNKFGTDTEENDEFITNWLNDNFQLDTDTYNIDFLVNQICHAMNKNFR